MKRSVPGEERGVEGIEIDFERANNLEYENNTRYRIERKLATS